MKFSKYLNFIKFFVIILFLLRKINTNTNTKRNQRNNNNNNNYNNNFNFNNNKLTMKSLYFMMLQYKIQTKSFLNNLIITANTVNKEYTKVNKNTKENKLKLKFLNKFFTKKKTKSKNRKENIEYNNNNKNKEFKYKKYDEIIYKMKKLSKKFPKFLKIKTAQKLYNLPNPYGYCGENKQK